MFIIILSDCIIILKLLFIALFLNGRVSSVCFRRVAGEHESCSPWARMGTNVSI